MILIWLFLGVTLAQEELLNNPDFEEPFGEDNWIGLNCDLIQTDEDAFTGQYSGRVENRSK